MLSKAPCASSIDAVKLAASLGPSPSTSARPAQSSTAVFEQERPRLKRLATRLLRSSSDADDIVQDAWLRWTSLDHDALNCPPAMLTRIVVRLCLDWLKSARVRREVCVGLATPEPPPEPVRQDLSGPLSVLAARLSSLEYAAFLLHDVFGEPLTEVARRLDRSAPAARQLAVRARRRIGEGVPRYSTTLEAGDRLAEAFQAATLADDPGPIARALAA